MRKRLLFRLVAIGLSAFSALLVAELALQLLDLPRANFSPWIRDRDTAFRYASGVRTRMSRPPEYDVAFATNAAGLRDDEIGVKHGVRLLLLGDSFASGYGVERPLIFADLLEDRLGVDVVNAGTGGFEIIHQVQYYLARGAALEPDLVLYALYLGNDLARNSEWRFTSDGGLVAKTREFPVRARHEVKLWRLVKMLRYRLTERAASERGPWRPFPDYLAMCARQLDADAAANYRVAEGLLRSLRDAVRNSGTELVVAYFSYNTAVDPMAEARLREEIADFDSRYDLKKPEREVEAMLQALGIDHLDLNVPLRAHYADAPAADDPLYFASDGHFTAAGHALVADALAAWLSARPELRDQ